MTVDEKLAAILAAVQIDPGNRGLARDPDDNLFTATAGQFHAACRSIAEHPNPVVQIYTGFYIPSATPPAYETDGPLGASFLRQSLGCMGIHVRVRGEHPIEDLADFPEPIGKPTHLIAVERPGPTDDGTFRTMRGRDITEWHRKIHAEYVENTRRRGIVSIGIGDGGNEIGMGNINRSVIDSNIIDGAKVHCQVRTNYLIVAGVSNWGAYALAAGVALLRNEVAEVVDNFAGDSGPAGLPWRELEILTWMVNTGPLVDGVTGRQEATVDGLPWDVYAAPLIRIREILEMP
jgi:hypothetical protein